MDPDRFWLIIQGAEAPDDLHRSLAELSETDLIAFERLHQARFSESYEWGLWGAAHVIQGGCGDDSFHYFRAYLISLGRTIYEAALADPDSLADVDLDADGEEWEDWMSPTMTVVFARTREYNFADGDATPAAAPTGPSGADWEEDDLPTRFPRLTARYG